MTCSFAMEKFRVQIKPGQRVSEISENFLFKLPTTRTQCVNILLSSKATIYLVPFENYKIKPLAFMLQNTVFTNLCQGPRHKLLFKFLFHFILPFRTGAFLIPNLPKIPYTETWSSKRAKETT